MSKRTNTSEVNSNHEDQYQEGYNEGFDEAFMPGVILGLTVCVAGYVVIRNAAHFVARKIEEKETKRRTTGIPFL